MHGSTCRRTHPLCLLLLLLLLLRQALGYCFQSVSWLAVALM
jgi:hypothetical protein